jgi:hypothetical protein
MRKVLFIAALFLLIIATSFAPRTSLAQTGCSALSSVGNFCTTISGQRIYCPSDAACQVFIENNSNSPDISQQEGQTQQTNQVLFPNETLCDGETGIKTAIGCIPFSNTNDFLAFILRWAIGIGGGIAFLLIVVAGFQIITSTGNPERLQAGRELLTSAIAGLIMLIFSVFILRIIGVDILGLGSFGLLSQ